MKCPICKLVVNGFERYGSRSQQGLCLHCKSKGRHRAVYLFLKRFVAPWLGPGSEILDVGPSRVAVRFFSRPVAIGRGRYTAIDIHPLDHPTDLHMPHRFLRMDVQELEFNSDSLDVILCNSLLFYVPNDLKALREIRRCLKDTGLAMINVHMTAGPTCSMREFARENPDIATPKYQEAYGTHWHYGEDFLERVSAQGLVPHVVRMSHYWPSEFLAKRGISPDHLLILCARDEGVMANICGSGRASLEVGK